MKSVFSKAVSLLVFTLFASSLAQAWPGLIKTPEEELTAFLRDTKKTNTDAVIIYKDGKVIYEFYDREYTPKTKHLSWSTAKTMSGILIGIAEGEGLLSINDPVKKYLPTFQNNARIIDVLGMASGIKYKEAFEGLPLNLDLTNMLYLEGQAKGYVDYMLRNPLSPTGSPGEYFNYSSGDTNILLGVLEKAINNKKVYDRYPFEKLFKPLGITATFEQDMAGTFVGSAYIYMSAPDFLKMGLLVKNKGVWNGKQITPLRYIELLNRVADGVQKKVQEGNPENKAYSSQAITNLPIEGRNQPSAYDDLPLDSVIMYGFQGQIVASSPSQDLVMVKLSMDAKDMDRLAFYAATKKFILAKGYKYETVGDSKTAEEKKQTVKNWSEQPPDDANSGPVASFPHLMRAFSAKEYCSCRFVIGRSEEACKDDLNAILKVLPELKINAADGTVTAQIIGGLFGQKAIAKYRGTDYGCTLIQSE